MIKKSKSRSVLACLSLAMVLGHGACGEQSSGSGTSGSKSNDGAVNGAVNAVQDAGKQVVDSGKAAVADAVQTAKDAATSAAADAKEQVKSGADALRAEASSRLQGLLNAAKGQIDTLASKSESAGLVQKPMIETAVKSLRDQAASLETEIAGLAKADNWESLVGKIEGGISALSEAVGKAMTQFGAK
ncbi:MAG: hypothetical protein SFZ23_02410 [Planctomycetota bacterium]|nr:hypothetical protein [Planctomycetota bacterium]